MKPCGRALRSVFSPILLLLAAAAVLGRPALERTLFKNIPRTDPAREVIQTVLGSRFYSMRDGFTASEWAGLGYGGAWERAKRYFPGSIYFVRPGTYFMTHGHDADGRLFMEIHESAYLTLCLENRRTFTRAAIVREYGRMLGAANSREAAAFRDKAGRLEAYFRDEEANRRLRRALGDTLYLRLLEGLREEDYHMLAGGLMHEGTHAGMDDALVARVQAEFNAGRRAVQWDEMRAFMAEIGYHGAFCRWAVEDIAGLWRQIEGLLGELERLRKKPALSAEADEARFDQTRVRAWTFAALARLRMREIWQSVRRMEDLSRSFRKDYVRVPAPPDLEEPLSKLEHDAAGFVAASGEAIRATELAVRSLEEVLDTWGAWASGRRPFPPPITDSQTISRQVKDIVWPDPASAATGAAALMKRAGEALEKERSSL
ncbi:MAG: hypothetical protein EHM31_08585 [Candidatus Aminicenantes bacterium]|nr:MAG: hypothetical protein EHM31_08585 [Candidatus Aminicenantes bacterium]